MRNQQRKVLMRSTFNDYNKHTFYLFNKWWWYSLNPIKYYENRGINCTGYLSSDYRNFNKGKQQEFKKRVKHTLDEEK